MPTATKSGAGPPQQADADHLHSNNVIVSYRREMAQGGRKQVLAGLTQQNRVYAIQAHRCHLWEEAGRSYFRIPRDEFIPVAIFAESYEPALGAYEEYLNMLRKGSYPGMNKSEAVDNTQSYRPKDWVDVQPIRHRQACTWHTGETEAELVMGYIILTEYRPETADKYWLELAYRAQGIGYPNIPGLIYPMPRQPFEPDKDVVGELPSRPRTT